MTAVLSDVSTTLHLPGADLIDQAFAEFLGYVWCRFTTGQVVGARIVRFLMSPTEFEQAKLDWPNGIALAAGDEHIEQLAFAPLPSFSGSRDQIARVEAEINSRGMRDLYMSYLRDELSQAFVIEQQDVTAMTVNAVWGLLTAEARVRARAAYRLIDGQRPRQQVLIA